MREWLTDPDSWVVLGVLVSLLLAAVRGCWELYQYRNRARSREQNAPGVHAKDGIAAGRDVNIGGDAVVGGKSNPKKGD